jgi:hypothetical protein
MNDPSWRVCAQEEKREGTTPKVSLTPGYPAIHIIPRFR